MVKICRVSDAQTSGNLAGIKYRPARRSPEIHVLHIYPKRRSRRASVSKRLRLSNLSYTVSRKKLSNHPGSATRRILPNPVRYPSADHNTCILIMNIRHILCTDIHSRPRPRTVRRRERQGCRRASGFHILPPGFSRSHFGRPVTETGAQGGFPVPKGVPIIAAPPPFQSRPPGLHAISNNATLSL